MINKLITLYYVIKKPKLIRERADLCVEMDASNLF